MSLAAGLFSSWQKPGFLSARSLFAGLAENELLAMFYPFGIGPTHGDASAGRA